VWDYGERHKLDFFLEVSLNVLFRLNVLFSRLVSLFCFTLRETNGHVWASLCVCVCVCVVCVCVCQRERERERERVTYVYVCIVPNLGPCLERSRLAYPYIFIVL